MTGAHEHWRTILRGRFDESRTFFATLRPRGLLGRTEEGLRELPLGELAGSRVLAVCAVAMPERFYETIRECEGTIVETLEFPTITPTAKGTGARSTATGTRST